MKSRGYQECVIPRRVFVLRPWLGIVALLVASLSGVAIVTPNPTAEADGEARLSGQVAREDLGAPVWSLAFSDDGAYLASATLTGDVWLKELATGRMSHLERGSWSSARSLGFAPATHILAVAGEHPTVRLWDVDAGIKLATLPVRRGFANAIAFSTDGILLAVSERGDDHQGGAIALWDWRTDRRFATLEGHAGVVVALTFSADGSQLASGDSRGGVTLWDMTTHRERRSLQAHENGRTIRAVAFSPDGTLLATASLLCRDVQLWDAATGELRGTLPAPTTGVNALAFSPLGPILAMARGDGAVAFWDVVGRRELGAPRATGASLQAVAISADGHRLATGSKDGAVCVWDLEQVLNNIPAAGLSGRPQTDAGRKFPGR